MALSTKNLLIARAIEVYDLTQLAKISFAENSRYHR